MPAWLNTPDLDLSTYPRNIPVLGHSLRTLINENNQVKVGNDVVDFTTNIGGNSAHLVASACGIIGFEKDDLFFDSRKKKLVYNCSLLPALFGSIVTGEAHLFRKNILGRWTISSTKFYSQIKGRLNKIDCSFDQNFAAYDDVRNWIGVSPRYRAWFRPTMAAKDYELLFEVELPNYEIFKTMNVDVVY